MFPNDILDQVLQPPKQALDVLGKKYPNVVFDSSQMDSEAHARAFTVAKITQLDVLQTLFNGIQTATAQGTGYDVFKKNAQEYLKQTGWWSDDPADAKQGKVTPSRLKLIYKTNTDQAYAAGRWQQMWETKDSRPYLQYLLDQRGVSTKHRDDHASLAGKVFSIEDAIWGLIYPPRGFNCNCGTKSISQAYLDRKKLKVESSDGKIVDVEITDPRTGETRTVQAVKLKGADGIERTIIPPRGFETNVGQAGLSGLDEVFINRLRSIGTDDFQKSMIEQFIKSKQRQAEYEQWVDDVMDTNYKKQGGRRTVGFITPEVESFLQQNNATISTRTITSTDSNIRKFINKTRSGSKVKSLTPDEVKSIPELLLNPDQVWYDSDSRNVLYVQLASNGNDIRLGVIVNYSSKNGIENILIHGSKTTIKDVVSNKKYLKIK